MQQVLVEQLEVTNFKSYEREKFTFGQGFHLLAGANGAGKTNVLDALYYLGMCRSYFSLRDRELVRHGQSFFRLVGHLDLEGGPREIVARVQPGKTKVFSHDRVDLPTLAAHIGLVPVVFICPNDTELVSGFSEVRRRLLDQTLCQVDNQYLQFLSHHQRLFQQRNAWLKDQQSRPDPDWAVLESLDRQLDPAVRYIGEARSRFAQTLLEQTAVNYRAISDDREHPTGRYRSTVDLSKPWSTQAASGYGEDLRLGRSAKGLHRDDLVLALDDHPARKFSSQGQRKSYVFSLKLAQYQYLADQRQVRPLLLLDDIFDKLDQQRVESLLRYVAGQPHGQVFITDTDPHRVATALAQINQTVHQYSLQESRLISIKGDDAQDQ